MLSESRCIFPVIIIASYLRFMNLSLSISLGKVNPRHNCCYIPWGGEEHSKEEYDVSFSELVRIKRNRCNP